MSQDNEDGGPPEGDQGGKKVGRTVVWVVVIVVMVLFVGFNCVRLIGENVTPG